MALYASQKELLAAELQEDYPDLEIKTVDGFQGREKEAILSDTSIIGGHGLDHDMEAMEVLGFRFSEDHVRDTSLYILRNNSHWFGSKPSAGNCNHYEQKIDKTRQL